MKTIRTQYFTENYLKVNLCGYDLVILPTMFPHNILASISRLLNVIDVNKYHTILSMFINKHKCQFSIMQDVLDIETRVYIFSNKRKIVRIFM